jgi:hypothetical protein
VEVVVEDGASVVVGMASDVRSRCLSIRAPAVPPMTKATKTSTTPVARLISSHHPPQPAGVSTVPCLDCL